MIFSRPTVGLVALLTALAGAATAQTAPAAQPGAAAETRPLPTPGAAATLPNTFDGPAARTPSPISGLSPSGASGVTDADVAEGVLRAVIADLAVGRIDDDLFTESTAARLRSQLPTLQSTLAGFGALTEIEAQGMVEDRAQFLVAFDNAATQWILAMNAEGRITALLFRPAPPVSSEPEAPATTSPAPGS